MMGSSVREPGRLLLDSVVRRGEHDLLAVGRPELRGDGRLLVAPGDRAGRGPGRTSSWRPPTRYRRIDLSDNAVQARHQVVDQVSVSGADRDTRSSSRCPTAAERTRSRSHFLDVARGRPYRGTSNRSPPSTSRKGSAPRRAARPHAPRSGAGSSPMRSRVARSLADRRGWWPPSAEVASALAYPPQKQDQVWNASSTWCSSRRRTARRGMKNVLHGSPGPPGRRRMVQRLAQPGRRSWTAPIRACRGRVASRKRFPRLAPSFSRQHRLYFSPRPARARIVPTGLGHLTSTRRTEWRVLRPPGA